jgi:hypothetical protein
MSEQPTASKPASPATPAPPPAPRLPAAAQAEGDTCPNCGAATWGEFCFACGQPRKGLIRRFSSILGDFLDTVFSIDNRLLRTLGPLYFKPGHLTCEYVAGRRVRYVTSFRLFFFLCVFSFFALKLYAEQSENAINFGDAGDAELAEAKTPEAVDAWLASTLGKLDAGEAGLRKGLEAVGSAQPAIDEAQTQLAKSRAEFEAKAAERKTWLAEVAAARAAGRPEPDDPLDELDGAIHFGDGPWDPEKNPIAIGWLPDAGNAILNTRAARATAAIRNARRDPKPLIEAFFAAIPPATFVLMPLFALLLKFMYLFKRRLYMEHLLTALHSHAFIFLSLLLISISLMLQEYVSTTRPWLYEAMDWMIVAMGFWIPLYLLIAQKRIYRQNWFATVFKFGVIGIAYMVLLAFGLTLAILLGMFNL